MNHLGDIAQLITAIVLALNFLQSWRNGKKSEKISADVQSIKVQTDGINSALVAATGKASLAEGTAAGIVEGHAAGLEQGRNEVRKPSTPNS